MKTSFQISDSVSLSNLAELVPYKNSLDIMRFLLSTSYIGFVSQVFVRTREYEAGLYFADICYSVIEQNTGEVTAEDFKEWDQFLIGLKLCMYDYLNDWSSYLSFHESMRTRNYTYTVGQPQNFRDLFGDDLVGRDKYGNCIIKFLSDRGERYKLIKRKHQKLLKGKPLGNMLRHQKEQLPREEREHRFQLLLRDFKFSHSSKKSGEE